MRMLFVVVATLISFATAASVGSAAPIYGTMIGTPGTHFDLVHWSDPGYFRPGRGYCFYHPHRGRCQ
jgi:hypothetical protein